MSLIVIQYPPDFDGELHIRQEDIYPTSRNSAAYRYEFVHVQQGSPWETLVKAAKAIIEQDERIKSEKVS